MYTKFGFMALALATMAVTGLRAESEDTERFEEVEVTVVTEEVAAETASEEVALVEDLEADLAE